MGIRLGRGRLLELDPCVVTSIVLCFRLFSEGVVGLHGKARPLAAWLGRSREDSSVRVCATLFNASRLYRLSAFGHQHAELVFVVNRFEGLHHGLLFGVRDYVMLLLEAFVIEEVQDLAMGHTSCRLERGKTSAQK